MSIYFDELQANIRTWEWQLGKLTGTPLRSRTLLQEAKIRRLRVILSSAKKLKSDLDFHNQEILEMISG